ncbi:hypothetical protein CUMW_135060 [Citrus unshiu]|nr:hypothetical protein CUMW_135060 [Citrus unshiu]
MLSQRFFPSEFGNDVDRVHVVEPARTSFATKAKIRRAVEDEGIPYTYVATFSQPEATAPPRDKVVIVEILTSGIWKDVIESGAVTNQNRRTDRRKAKIREALWAEGIQSYCFDGYFLPNLLQPEATAPPRDKVVILGDGNPKAVFNKEDDIGTYTIKAVDDPRTLNKNFYIQPPGNIYSFNDLVSLWERKIGKTLEKEYVSEEQLLKNIQEAAPPHNVILSIYHSAFVKGVQTNFKIEPSFGVEASQLYPDVKYTTVDEYLNQFV